MEGSWRALHVLMLMAQRPLHSLISYEFKFVVVSERNDH